MGTDDSGDVVAAHDYKGQRSWIIHHHFRCGCWILFFIYLDQDIQEEYAGL